MDDFMAPDLGFILGPKCQGHTARSTCRLVFAYCVTALCRYSLDGSADLLQTKWTSVWTVGDMVVQLVFIYAGAVNLT